MFTDQLSPHPVKKKFHKGEGSGAQAITSNYVLTSSRPQPWLPGVKGGLLRS